jgi:hypothetical protein
MNKLRIRAFLAGMAVILASLACAIGPQVAPTASPPPIPTLQPTALQESALPPTQAPMATSTPEPALPAAETPVPAPTDTATPEIAPTDTPFLNIYAVLQNNGFERAVALDEGCHTACSAYKNSSVDVIADYYYTNGSFSLLYYAKDKNGQNEQAQSAVVTKLLSELYPGTLAGDVMSIANDFPNQQGTKYGSVGNFIWSISINIVNNLDKTIKSATIYISVSVGG